MKAMSVTNFICAVRDRFIRRGGLAPENAVDSALAAIETWEDVNGPAELTMTRARSIADARMAEWGAA